MSFVWSVKPQLGSFDCLVWNGLGSVDHLTLGTSKKHGLLGVQTCITSCQREVCLPCVFQLGFARLAVECKGKIRCKVSRVDEVSEVKLIELGYSAKIAQDRTDWM